MARNVFTPEQEKWLQALESGEWKQCRDVMHDDEGGHCCLGVLAIVCSLPQSHLSLTDESAARMKMRGREGPFHTSLSTGHWQLTGLNDGAKWSFSQIAAFIRAKPWQGFTNFDVPEKSA